MRSTKWLKSSGKWSCQMCAKGDSDIDCNESSNSCCLCGLKKRYLCNTRHRHKFGGYIGMTLSDCMSIWLVSATPPLLMNQYWWKLTQCTKKDNSCLKYFKGDNELYRSRISFVDLTHSYCFNSKKYLETQIYVLSIFSVEIKPCVSAHTLCTQFTFYPPLICIRFNFYINIDNLYSNNPLPEFFV